MRARKHSARISPVRTDWAVLAAGPPGGACGCPYVLRALPGERRVRYLAVGEVFMTRQPVQGAAVAPHHVGAVVGVDLGEQRPPCLLGRYPGITRVPAAQRSHGYLPFHRALNRVRVTPNLMMGSGRALREGRGERGVVDG